MKRTAEGLVFDTEEVGLITRALELASTEFARHAGHWDDARNAIRAGTTIPDLPPGDEGAELARSSARRLRDLSEAQAQLRAQISRHGF